MDRLPLSSLEERYVRRYRRVVEQGRSARGASVLEIDGPSAFRYFAAGSAVLAAMGVAVLPIIAGVAILLEVARPSISYWFGGAAVVFLFGLLGLFDLRMWQYMKSRRLFRGARATAFDPDDSDR